MNIMYSLAFVAGTLFASGPIPYNTLPLGGILVIGIFSKKKKISFVLGLIWGLGFMVLDINGFQVMQRKIPSEIYLIPPAYGFLTLFITWLKTLLVKWVGKIGHKKSGSA